MYKAGEENILLQVRESAEKPKPKYHFEKGDQVRINEGPFTNFNGSVDEVSVEEYLAAAPAAREGFFADPPGGLAPTALWWKGRDENVAEHKAVPAWVHAE